MKHYIGNKEVFPHESGNWEDIEFSVEMKTLTKEEFYQQYPLEWKQVFPEKKPKYTRAFIITRTSLFLGILWSLVVTCRYVKQTYNIPQALKEGIWYDVGIPVVFLSQLVCMTAVFYCLLLIIPRKLFKSEQP